MSHVPGGGWVVDPPGAWAASTIINSKTLFIITITIIKLTNKSHAYTMNQINLYQIIIY